MPEKYANSLDCEVLGKSGQPPKENWAVPEKYASSLDCEVLGRALDTHSLGQIGYRQEILLPTRDGEPV